MKISIQKKDLLSLCARGQGVADKKSPMPVLGCLLLDAAKGQLRVVATDLRIGVESAGPCEVMTPGSVALPARDLFDRVKSMPEGPLTLDVDHDAFKCVMKAVGSARRHTLSSLPGREYPAITKVGDDYVKLSLPAGVLVALLAQTEFSASIDQTRPHMNGVLVEWGEGVLRAVSTDSHRLTMAEAKVDVDKAGSILIPLKAVGELRRLLESSEADEVAVAYKAPWAFFTAGASTLSVNTSDGTFPPYRQIMPEANKGDGAAVDRAALAEAVRSVGLAAEAGDTKKTGAVVLTLSSQKLLIDAGASDSSPAHDEMSVNYEGKDRVWRMNHRYLLDALGAVDCEEVEFSGEGDLDPILMRPTGETNGRTFTSILMPMRS